MAENFEDVHIGDEAGKQLDDLYTSTLEDESWKPGDGNLKKWVGQRINVSGLEAKLVEIAIKKYGFVCPLEESLE